MTRVDRHRILKDLGYHGYACYQPWGKIQLLEALNLQLDLHRPTVFVSQSSQTQTAVLALYGTSSGTSVVIRVWRCIAE